MIFDTHAHYYDEAFDADRDPLLSSLPERGVALVVCPGCDLESSRQCVDLAERYDYIYAAVGFHPENLEGASLTDQNQIRTLAAPPRVKAIGEVGLTGELRAVSHLGQRLSEVHRLGFRCCVIPRQGTSQVQPPEGLEILRVRHIREAIETLL